MSDKKSTAVVIGASVAGLLAAAALSRYFDEVVVFENDVAPQPDQVRKGVPQGNHVHGFLAAGCLALETLLPGIIDEAIGLGAQTGDMLADARFYVGARTRFISGQSNIKGLVASRPLLEFAIYRRVSGLPNVSIRHQVKVTGLQFGPSNRTVTGVVWRAKDGPDAAQFCRADLVIDASGRGTQSPRWLRQAGYAEASRDGVTVNLTYTSCWFRRHPRIDDAIRAVFVAPDARHPVPSGMMEQDGEYWIISCGSYGDHPAPADLPAFLDYLQRHSVSEIHAVASFAEPIGELHHYRYSGSVRHRYEKLKRFPAGLLIVGDAFCSFNPVYGQGMSSAAKQAVVLDRHLARAGHGDWRRFFKQTANIVADPWNFDIHSDLSLPGVSGKRGPGFNLVQRYIDRMMRAASKDLRVATSVLQVIHMLKPGASLFSPALVLRVLQRGRTP